MITLRVEARARALGIGGPAMLAQCSKVPPSVCSALWHGTAKVVALSDLSALCTALECGPGDLLAHDGRLVMRLAVTPRDGG